MEKNKKILFILGGSLFLLLLVLLLLTLNSQKKDPRVGNIEYLIEQDNVEEKDSIRRITSESSDSNLKTVANYYDGYTIEVPENWFAKEEVYRNESLKIFFNEDNEYNEEIDFPGPPNGFSLLIQMFDNPEKRSLANWLADSSDATRIFPYNKFENTKLNGGKAYKTSQKILNIDEIDEPLSKNSFIEKSLKIDYVFSSKEKIYVVTCASVGEKYQEFIKICEKQIPTFTIL